MSLLGKITPAFLWRAFFFFSCASTLACAAVAPNPAPPLLQIGKPSDAEAETIIRDFRESGIPGQFFWEIELQAMPPRGATKVYRGRIWGGRNAEGALYRVELTDAAGGVRRLLLQNGERAGVWRFLDGQVSKVEVEGWLEPLLPGLEITAFDLLMPFLYWPNPTVERITRTFGRTAHQFLLRPPPDFAAKHPEITAARVYLDGQVNQPLQSELLGAGNRVTKRFSLITLKKIGEQMIPKSIDFRNEATGSKTRLLVTGVAFNLDFSPALFEPASLAETILPPAGGRVLRTD